MGRLHIVALGSSFASGPGIDPIVDQDAQRSGKNYARILATKLDADLTDLTASGATLLNVLSEPHVTRTGKTLPPQLDALKAAATSVDIITLTAGGNDLGYISGLTYDSVMRYLAYLGPLQYLLRYIFPPPASDLSEPALRDRFVAVIDAARAAAPRAKLFLVDYLSVFGRDAAPGHGNPLNWHQVGEYKRLGTVLTGAFELAVRARPEVEFVPMENKSQRHGLGSSEPWVEGFSLAALWSGRPAVYHPNAKGHEAVAVELEERIRKLGLVDGEGK